MSKSLFDSYGGFTMVRRVVSTFYESMLDSERLAPYFAETDMRALIDHQTKFIAQVMGGPVSYTDEALRRIHAPIAVTGADFDEMAALLKMALVDHDLDADDVADVMNEIYRRKHLIVGQTERQGSC